MTDMKTKLLKIMFLLTACTFAATTANAIQIRNNQQADASFVNTITNTRLPIELKSMTSDSYKVAAIHFLGTESDLSFSKKDVIDDKNVNDGAKRCDGYNVIGTDCRAKGAGWFPSVRCPSHSNYYKLCIDCSSYTLDTQPENAAFSKCDNGKFKITACNSGYKLEGSSCVYGCSDYPLTSKPANAATVSTCEYDNSKMKLASCNDGYSVNGNSCQCIPAVPAGYQTANNCDYGLESTQNDHCGIPYYKCKAVSTCAAYLAANLPEYTPVSDGSALSAAISQNKNKIVILNDMNVDAALNISGKKLMGANKISASSLCTNMAMPTLTFTRGMTSNNDTEITGLKLIYGIPEESSSSKKYPLITGGGTIDDVFFDVIEAKIYNYYGPQIFVTGTMNIKNASIRAQTPMAVGTNGTLNIKGIVDLTNSTKANTAGHGQGIASYDTDTNIKINIEAGSQIRMHSNTGNGFRLFNLYAQSNTVNFDGGFVPADVQYGAEVGISKGGTLNINAPLKVASLSASYGTVNINAQTTIDAESPNKSITAITTYKGTINVNAPLYINNFIPDDNYSNVMSAATLYVNNQIVANNNISLLDSYPTKVQITSNGKIKGLGRLQIKTLSSSPATFQVASGAQIEIGGTCKKATSASTKSFTNESWTTPPTSIFSGSCSNVLPPLTKTCPTGYSTINPGCSCANGMETATASDGSSCYRCCGASTGTGKACFRCNIL